MAKPKLTITSKLVGAARRVWRAFLKFGPVDDGRPEGDEFDRSLIALSATAKLAVRLEVDYRAALVAIISAADEVGGEPIHYKVREAIENARLVIAGADATLTSLAEALRECKQRRSLP